MTARISLLSTTNSVGSNQDARDTACVLAPLSFPKVLPIPNLDVFKSLKLCHMVTGTRRIARHASLCRQHDRTGMLYLVRIGQFKLISGKLNEERVAGFSMAGDVLGLDAIATGEQNFHVKALEDSEVYEIPFARIGDAIGAEPAIRLEFLRIMSEALINEYRQSSLLATGSLEVRFAAFLIWLGQKHARRGCSSRAYLLNMSRQDIGSYLGTTLESISRLIGRFNAQGKVMIKGRAVELLDLPFLQAMADGNEASTRA